MDSFRLCVALGPLAIYFLLLAVINLSRRPFLVNGARDLAALGVGVSGLMLVGPIELLLPDDAITHYQGYVWLLLITMYSLCLSLAVLLARPRLTVYNFTADELRPVLAETIDQLDPEARWAGGSLSLPRLHVELHIEANAALRNVSLVATGDRQSFSGWRQLESALAGRLTPAEAVPNAFGAMLALAAAAMFVAMGWQIVLHPHEVTQGFSEMMRL